MELVTGRKGVAHITSQQDRMKHQGTWGDGAYILKTGQMLEPQVQSSNEIRIRDGALMVQGALGCVKVNTYDPVTIQNGSQGMKRIDLICWQYSYDAEQDVESAEWVVIQGTPAESDPQQPAYTDGDIQQGDSPVQVPVFAVELDGINVTGVTTLLPTAPTLEDLNSNIINTKTTKAVPSKTDTMFYDSGNLTDGLYLVCAHAASETSIDNIYVLDVMYDGGSKQAVRGSMLNGGGVCNTAMIQCVNGNAIGVRIYQAHTSSVDITANISVTRLH